MHKMYANTVLKLVEIHYQHFASKLKKHVLTNSLINLAIASGSHSPERFTYELNVHNTT